MNGVAHTSLWSSSVARFIPGPWLIAQTRSSLWAGLLPSQFSQAQQYPCGQVQACIRNLEARPKSMSAVFEGASSNYRWVMQWQTFCEKLKLKRGLSSPGRKGIGWTKSCPGNSFFYFPPTSQTPWHSPSHGNEKALAGSRQSAHSQQLKVFSRCSSSRGGSWRLNPEVCPIRSSSLAPGWLQRQVGKEWRFFLLFFTTYHLKANLMFHISILGTVESPSDLNSVISVRKPPKTNERISSTMILRGVGGRSVPCIIQYKSHCSQYQEETRVLMN